jgi:GNAT superfamily N-acetyltransferase
MKDGYRSICKECYNARERVRERRRYAQDPEYRGKKIGRATVSYYSDVERKKSYARGYARKNRTARNAREALRRKADAQWAIKTRLMSRFSGMMHSCGRKTKGMYGYEWEEYKTSLICRDTDAYLAWRRDPSKYHIDHIIPCSIYDFTNDNDIWKCFHPKNMRIIKGAENIRKSNKMEMDLVHNYGIGWLMPESFREPAGVAG